MKQIIVMGMVALILPSVLASTKIYPSDDGFVRDRHSNSNYGSIQDLRTGYNVNYGTDRTYLKFNLSELQGKTINSAVLSIDPLFSQPINNPVINLYLTSNSWDENSITWDNKPNKASLIDSQIVSSPDRIEFNIPEISENEVSLVMIEQNEDTDAHFASKEYNKGMEGAEDYWPYLEFEVEDDCNTEADTDCDGCVSMGEILSYINEWKIGNAPMGKLLTAINMWKTGAGC